MRNWLNAIVVSLAVAGLSGCAAGGDSRLEDALTRIDGLEQKNSELQATIEVLEARIAHLAEGGAVIVCLAQPKIDAFVLTVDRATNQVVLNKGKRDEVRVDYTFDIYYRSTYRGLVRITEVRDGTSTAAILSEKNPITPGDSATTVL